MTGIRGTIPIHLDSDEELSKCLKPCPFCGSTDVSLVQDRYGSWGVECHGYMCHAYLTNCKWRCERRMDAIALWNKRVKG